MAAERVVGLKEACLALDLSEKTLRKKLVSGEIRGEKIQTKEGERWRIWLPAAADAPSLPEREPQEEPAAVGEVLSVLDPESVSLALYRELLDRHAQTVEQLGYQRAQAERVPGLEEEGTAREGELRAGWEQLTQARERQARLQAWAVVGWGLAAALGAAVVWLALR